jgi:hypothetical protein
VRKFAVEYFRQASETQRKMTKYLTTFDRYRKRGTLAVVVSCLALFFLEAICSQGFAQSASQGPEEWDAVETGLVRLLAQGNPALGQPPAIQIVSPPIDLDHKDPEVLRRILVQTADTIPEWGPYFRPSGRTLREEFQAFLGSIEASVSSLSSLQPGVPTDSTAFGFTPDIAEPARMESLFLEPERFQWKVMTNSGAKNTRASSIRIRLRIGPIDIKHSVSRNEQEVDSQLAEGVFSVTGMSSVSVIPGRWFSDQLMERFAKGPFKSKSGIEQWWGPKGRLSLYPKSLVIVSDPSFSLRLDARSYRQVKTAFAGGASIGVGPFEIMPTGGNTPSFDDKQFTITMKQKTRGMIVAIINQVNNLP